MSSKTSKAAKKPDASVGPVKVQPPRPEKDRFDCREGSQAATINAAITTKPKAADKIAEETGLALARVRAHLKHLMGKGFVTESDAGFAVKGKAK